KLREESLKRVKEGRRRILELAQQLRGEKRLGRTHSDPSVNIKKEDESGKSTRKTKSTESAVTDRTSTATTWSTAPTTGQQPSFQDLSAATQKAAEPPGRAVSFRFLREVVMLGVSIFGDVLFKVRISSEFRHPVPLFRALRGNLQLVP
ncbi:hypothetical protein OSTOST_06417, partial [Ostertagia ostertagi]